MKKIVLTLSMVAAIVATSCAGGTAAEIENEGSALKAKIENCTNSDSLKVYARQARAYADRLVRDGRKDVADTYMRDVKALVKSKDASISCTTKCCNADDKAKVAEDSVKKVAEKVGDAAVKVKDKTVDGVKKAGKKTVNAVSDAVDKAGSAIDKAATKSADKIREIDKK